MALEVGDQAPDLALNALYGQRVQLAPAWRAGQLTIVWMGIENVDNPPPGYVTRVRVDRIEGVGPWAGRTV